MIYHTAGNVIHILYRYSVSQIYMIAFINHQSVLSAIDRDQYSPDTLLECMRGTSYKVFVNRLYLPIV